MITWLDWFLRHAATESLFFIGNSAWTSRARSTARRICWRPTRSKPTLCLWLTSRTRPSWPRLVDLRAITWTNGVRVDRALRRSQGRLQRKLAADPPLSLIEAMESIRLLIAGSEASL